jgi:hypothetical protein
MKLEKRLPMLTVPSNDLRRYCLLILLAVHRTQNQNLLSKTIIMVKFFVYACRMRLR